MNFFLRAVPLCNLRSLALPALGAVVIAIAICADARAQGCAADAPPLTVAPIPGLDASTFALGSFNSGVSLSTAGGAIATKTTMTNGAGGIFGTSGLAVPGSRAVAIYPSAGFPTAKGTIEMWARTALSWNGRAYLFSIDGAGSLDGDTHADLVFGETTSSTAPATSRIYMQNAGGLDLAQPATFTTSAPRGIAVGDVNGDGIADLVVANNTAATLASPVTPTPGEVHFYYGPFAAGTSLGAPDQILEVDKPQGLVLADLDLNGTLDLVVASYVAGLQPLHGFSNDGHANFTPLSFSFFGVTDTAEAVGAGDVNGDGVTDLMYATLNPGAPTGFGSLVMRGTISAGSYSIALLPGFAWSISGGALGASFGDVNADGMLDAVLAQPFGANGAGTGSIAVHLNNGDGSFDAAPDAVIPTTRPFTLNATRDLNQDGAIDVAVANWRQGGFTTPTSTVFFGPISGPGIPPSSEFLVDDAVSTAIGDLNGDGTDDLVFHSATALVSPIFLLDINGNALGGSNGLGQALPSVLLPSQPTVGNTAGEGSGMDVAFGGTATYGSVQTTPGTIELYAQSGNYVFAVTDAAGVRHSASVAIPASNAPWSVNGYNHVQAEWDAAAGVVELRVGHPGLGAKQTVAGAPFTAGAIAKQFRLGTDPQNQSRAAGFAIDDLRISTVRRSASDRDGDGTEDGFDDCPFLANPDQLDSNGDGIGDACAFCQANMGFQGPGNLQMSVCGKPLVAGATAAFRLRCGPPGATVGVFASLFASPQSALGGTIVPLPVMSSFFTSLDATGQYVVPVPGLVGPLDIYAQAIAVDGSRPNGAAISNAVQIHFP